MLQSGLVAVKATSAALTLRTELMLCRPARLFLETRTHGSERITGPCVHLLRKADLIMQHQMMFSQISWIFII